jgi:hypothetical protein
MNKMWHAYYKCSILSHNYCFSDNNKYKIIPHISNVWVIEVGCFNK